MNKLRPSARLVLWLTVSYSAGCVVAGIALAEISLRLPKRPLGDASTYRADVREQFHASVEDVAIVAADQAVLRAWYAQPRDPNGKAVILLHGITDNRIGVSGYGDFFLAHGYSVLLPDSREHGDSGGAIATYGIMEKDDVRRWVSWLRTRSPVTCPPSPHVCDYEFIR